MGSSRQNVKQLALKLEEKGFLKIEKDEQDARALRLKLTEKSRAFWEERQNKDDQFLKDLFSGLEEQEVDCICNSFNKLCNLKTSCSPDLNNYDRVIIGGSIYAGMIQKEIKKFCTQNIDNLKSKKLGLYICCIVGKNAEMQLNSSYPQELLDYASAKDSFGGEMKISEMNFAEKFITRMVSKIGAKSDSGMPPIDMKKDLSMLSEDGIDRFAKAMIG